MKIKERIKSKELCDLIKVVCKLLQKDKDRLEIYVKDIKLPTEHCYVCKKETAFIRCSVYEICSNCLK